MLIRNILPASQANGPGNRAVVWFQGCQLRCPGCFNQWSHAMTSREAEYYSPLRLATEIETLRGNGIDGVTFSGGEPMHQAYELAELVALLKRADPELSLGMYTGYTEGELNGGRYIWKRVTRGSRRGLSELILQRERSAIWLEIRSRLDFAVMGRFNQQLRSTETPLCASSNQDLVLFSDRYRPEDFPPQQVEFSISEAGDRVQVTGFPSGALT